MSRSSFAFCIGITAFAAGLAIATDARADYTITCGSEDGRHNTCAINNPGYVMLVRQISRARCEQGRSWDYDRRELWVDRGCVAEFRVESPSSSNNKDAAAAVAIVAGAAILGALINNKDHKDDHKYQDPNYYGSRHTSYVPSWMVGAFRGYNPMYGVEVTMTIQADGRMTGYAQGQTINGYINDHQLHVGQTIFDIDQTREGFTTSQKGDRANEVRYRRI